MLYFLTPAGPMRWSDAGRDVLKLAKDRDFDLSSIDWWQPSELVMGDDDVRVAIRYGVRATGGLVLEGYRLDVVRRPGDLRRLGDDLGAVTHARQENPTFQATEEFLEALAPGWKGGTAKTDREVAKTVRRSVRDAERDARRQLKKRDPRGKLVEHWTASGGSIPDPR